MSIRIRHITVDCTDPYTLARFWAELLGYREDPTEAALQPGADEALIGDPRGAAGLLFIRVPEAKSAKNRLHFDLWPEDIDGPTRDESVERVLTLGGSVVDDRREPDGSGWVVFADPEGNEFCLERSRAECYATEPDRDEYLRDELDLAYERQLRLLSHVQRRLTEITAQRKRLDLEVSVAATAQQGDAAETTLEALRARARERTRAEHRTQALAHELQAEVSSFRAEIDRHRAEPEARQAQTSLDQLNALLDTLPGVGAE